MLFSNLQVYYQKLSEDGKTSGEVMEEIVPVNDAVRTNKQDFKTTVGHTNSLDPGHTYDFWVSMWTWL